MSTPNPFVEIYEKLDRIENLLTINSNPVPNVDKDHYSPYLTITQAAEFLGLAVPTVYGLVHRKQIVCHKPGKILYFSKTDLLNYLESGRKRSLSEIHEEAVDKLKRRNMR